MADLTVTAGSVLAGSGASKRTGIAGETITAGMPVYLHDNGRYKKAINTFPGASGARNVVGISLNDAANGQEIDICTAGDINVGATLTVGQLYLLSTNSGKIMPGSDFDGTATGIALGITKIGIATTASNLRLDIQNSGAAYVAFGA